MPENAIAPAPARSTQPMLCLLYFIFFFCGMTQCFESVFLPEFKEIFALNYQHQMYTMFAKNIPFLLSFVVGIHAAKVGYRNFLAIAMALYTAGTLLLVYGLQLRRYEVVLLAFFTIGTGFTIQLVVGGPLIGALGPAESSSSRLNFGNALGAIAQIIAPLSLSFVIPAAASVQGKLPYMQGLFISLGGVLAVVAVITLFTSGTKMNASLTDSATSQEKPARGGSIWRHPKVVLGFVTIFLILGTEAGLFGFFRNYLESPDIAGLSSHQSQRLFTLYFALFALGRLLASPIQKKLKPVTHMALHILAAVACLLTLMFAKGTVAVVAVVAIGFFVSIFFPTLYALAIDGMGELTGAASGLVTLGFLGCALLPVLQGRLADMVGISRAYGMGLISYAFALFYVLRGWRIKPLAPGGVA